MKNVLRAVLVVIIGVGSIGCCSCNSCCNDGCGSSRWWWHPFCCAGCGPRSHLDWWQNPPPCCNPCNQCGQWHGQMYGSGPTGGYYSDGYAGGSPMMVDDGEVVESDGATPPAPQAAPAQMQPQQQPTPAAQRRPVRRTSNMRQRPPMQRQYYQAANQNYQAANQNGPANHYPDQYQQ